MVAVETHGADSLGLSLRRGKWSELGNITSMATTLGAKRVAERAFELGQGARVTAITVSDELAVKACADFAADHRALVEPACGAALSVVYNNLRALRDAASVLVVVCDGIGTDPAKLRDWQELFNL